MNSGRDFVTREMDVASPVMASGMAQGNQGGDLVLMPASSQEPADSTLGLNVPAGEPSASRRSTRMPRPSSPSDGPESRTSVTSFHWHVGTGTLRMTDPDIAATIGHMPLGLLRTSGPAASHARTSASQGSAADSPAHGPASPSPSSTLWGDTDPGSSSSRTFRAFSPVMEARTLGRSSLRWSNSGTAWDTGYSTLATSECRSADGACSSSETRLADVLEPSAPQRFYLSARAATGILRRASKRGRELPSELALTLTSLAQPPGPAASATTTTPTPSSPTPFEPRTGITDTDRRAAMDRTTSSVRRLTPVEAEALMGWPPGHTIVHNWKGKGR